MPVRLIALDIDGTLLTSRGELTARNRAAIDEARRRGIEVVLVTGRRFASARALLLELELGLPLVSHNGALTKNIETLETLDFHPLDAGIAREIIHMGRRFGADMICCDDPHGLGTMVIEGISEGNRALHRYLNRYHESVVRVDDLIEYVRHSPIQMMFSGRCDPMIAFAGDLEIAMDGRVRLFQTRYRTVDLTILDALSLSASKGASLQALAEARGIDQQEVMAIGDNHNDLTMLEYAGLGVVMANAEDELKHMGFLETLSNDEDGVAVAIERHALETIYQGEINV